MWLSVFDVFKVGIGPSSSHTMGPMVAMVRFLREVCGGDEVASFDGGTLSVRVTLYGSLSLTGRGHGTDRAVIGGLLGFVPDKFDAAQYQSELEDLRRNKVLHHGGLRLRFDPAADVVFSIDAPLAGHPNGMMAQLLDGEGDIVAQEVYYSIGGGVVMTEAELANRYAAADVSGSAVDLPHPFTTSEELLAQARVSGKSIAQMVRANEAVLRRGGGAGGGEGGMTLDDGLSRIWRVMRTCMERGLSADGILPGGLRVRRRAAGIADNLRASVARNDSQPHRCNDWISVYAMAVNEENAAGNTVVTAPTNGAAGVVPAVIRYWLEHCHGAEESRVGEFLLTAAAVGGLIKTNASVSGAEVGCQGEVGSASSMAAAGLCAVLGGTPEQIENAAEIALEHHLGMTCDPVGGLVQVPCIERNALGAIKAVASASLALHGDGEHFVSLDSCIETMRQTGLDMNSKYKETSLGGLAVNVPEC